MKNINKNRIYKMILLVGVSLITVAAIINSESSSTIISMGDVDIPESGSDWSFLRINDVSNLGSCDVTLSWDPDVVTVTDVNDSDFDSMDYYVDDTSGVLYLNAFSYDALNGDFTIAKLTFEPASGASAGDECDLEITDSILFTAEPMPSEILHSRENGMAQINNVGSGVLVTMDDVNIPEGGNEQGHLRTYNILNLGSCDVTLSWDPDVVTVIDVSNSDFDFMGHYVDDATGILNVNAFSYDSMNGDFTVAEVTFEPASGASAGDESDLEITDSILFTAEPMPSEILHSRENGMAQIISDESMVEVRMDNVYVPEDGSDRGLLIIKDVTNLGSCDFTLSWDPNVVTLTDVEDGDFDSMSHYVDDATGILNINAFSYDSMNGDFTFAKLTFEPASSASAGDECDLEITDSILFTAEPIESEISHNRMDGTAYIKTTSAGDDDDDGTNKKPIADASASEQYGNPNSPVIFDGSKSSDPDGTIDMYKWDWDNDGFYDISSITTTHSFDSIGTYKVTLKVYDNDGATDTDTINVVIAIANNPPTKPVIDGPKTGNKNTNYEYTAVSTDLDNDSIQYIFDWNDGEETTTEFLSNGTATNQMHSWTSAGEYTISVSAYDNQTESGSTKYTVLIDAWPIVNDINGYLGDDDSDGIYDFFYNSETGEKTDAELQEDGTYFIDIDGDGDWDYVYDIETDTHTEYEEPGSEGDNTVLYILVIIFIIIIIFGYYLVKRK